MKCYEGHEPPPLSSSTSCTPQRGSSFYTHRNGGHVHASSKLPLLRPSTETTPTTSSHGLARYFQGLAAGEDLAELIRSLRCTICTCYQECMRKGKVLPDADSSLNATVKDTSASEVTPTAPHRLPPGTLSMSQSREYWAATRAAFLFAAESRAASEEATSLHCSSVTRSVLFPYYYPMGDINENGNGVAAAAAATSAALPLGGVLRGRDMTVILNDERMVELAKEEVRHNPRNGWQAALRLLRQVSPTPLTCAVELELYRQTCGHHWAEALRCLWTLPTAQWTEMDAGAVLRALYHAGRRVQMQQKATKQKTRPSTPVSSPQARFSPDDKKSGSARSESSQVFLARLTAQALRIHRAVEEEGVLKWSTPSAFNDTLGLVAQDPGAWREACMLLDNLIAARAPVAAADVTAFASKACASVKGTAAAGEDGVPHGITSARSGSASYQLVRPNAVTIHQICRALQQQWNAGLRYVQILEELSGDSTDFFEDIAATEDVLRLCISGQRWQEALNLVAKHQAATQGKRLQSFSHKSLSSYSPPFATNTPSSPSHAVAAELLGDRKHYRPDVLVELVRLLGSVAASRPVALALLRSHEGNVEVTAKKLPAPGNAVKVALSRSKYYNMDTLSRAYNCLLQGSATLSAADIIVDKLNQHYCRKSEGAASVTVEGDEGSSISAAASELYNKLAGLETESVAHVAYLSCVAGNWERALHHTNALLHSPRYQATFFPTARLHDAVQYALEQAPQPGPSWQLSLKLFTDMMRRNVPSSEISFQSVVKQCFAGGAPDQAQKLFYFVLKRGVRS